MFSARNMRFINAASARLCATMKRYFRDIPTISGKSSRELALSSSLFAKLSITAEITVRSFSIKELCVWLTEYGEMNPMADRWGGRYLALVDTGILFLRISYSQNPFFRVKRVQRLETLIARVSVATDCQQVNVTMPHPRNLRTNDEVTI